MHTGTTLHTEHSTTGCWCGHHHVEALLQGGSRHWGPSGHPFQGCHFARWYFPACWLHYPGDVAVLCWHCSRKSHGSGKACYDRTSPESGQGCPRPEGRGHANASLPQHAGICRCCLEPPPRTPAADSTGPVSCRPCTRSSQKPALHHTICCCRAHMPLAQGCVVLPPCSSRVQVPSALQMHCSMGHEEQRETELEKDGAGNRAITPPGLQVTQVQQAARTVAWPAWCPGA